jgi:radical SAM family uncharacterized protein/radical SAM-linked protein
MNPWEEIISLVRQPARYVSGEVNARNKDLEGADLKVVLAFPDIYEMGMSHLGVRILYHLLNDLKGVACDRAYMPWVDLEERMRRQGIPLLSLEAQRPLREFDLLGFSMTHELCYTNVLDMLELAGIPLLAKDRKGSSWPLVIGGGHATANPEPVAEFFDAFLFGEGEEAVVQIVEAMKDWKKSQASRQELLNDLSEIEGVYIPEFFEPKYNDDGTVSEIKPLKPGYDKVRRRIVADLDAAYFPKGQLVPAVEAVHDRLMVEIARGCTRGCRFCQAGIIYLPYRERSGENIENLVEKGLESTGYEECSFLSLSAGDYSGIEPLLIRFMHNYYPKRIAVSLPSLRVESLTETLMKAIKKVRKTGFTIAPEAATERLRRIINKPLSNDELFNTVEKLFASQWKTIKLYFMIGLPGETQEDREEIIHLVREIEKTGRRFSSSFQVNVSVTAFVPKPHTPFQWEAQIRPEEQADIQNMLKRALQGKRIKIKWQDARLSALEGVFSRGDRRLMHVLLAARSRGLNFEGWTERFDPRGWEDAFQDAGIDPQFYLRERRENEILPWGHMDARVNKKYILRERKRAKEQKTTPDCRELYRKDHVCKDFCGVCQGKIKPVITAPLEASGDMKAELKTSAAQPEIFFRYRITYRRFGPARFYGHLEINRALVRAVRRASLPMRYSQGFHPLPKMVFGPCPPVGVESEAEYLEVEMVEHWSAERVKQALGRAMPPGLELREVKEIALKAPPVTVMINMFKYSVEPPRGTGSDFFDPGKIKQFQENEVFNLLQKREKGDRNVDLKPLVSFMEKNHDGSLVLGVRVVPGPGVKPGELVAAVFNLDHETERKLRIIRTEAVFKTAGPLRYPGRAIRSRDKHSRRAGRTIKRVK